jgi:hypothetical protein
MLDQLRTIAEGPALGLPPVAWEPPNYIGLRAVAGWDDPEFGGQTVYLSPTGTSHHPHPLIDLGDERLSVEQAEVAARHLLAAVAMAREVSP